jgi:hypothetical protein
MPFAPGTRVDVLMRPDDIVHDDASPVKATVLHKAFKGAEFLYTLALSRWHRSAFHRPLAPRPRPSVRRMGIRLDI